MDSLRWFLRITLIAIIMSPLFAVAVKAGETLRGGGS
jgi:hypothetical protein